MGIGHSAQFGLTLAAPPERSHTFPLAQADALSAAQPLPPTVHVWSWVLLVEGHETVPFVHEFVQHMPPLHAPFVHGLLVAW